MAENAFTGSDFFIDPGLAQHLSGSVRIPSRLFVVTYMYTCSLRIWMVCVYVTFARVHVHITHGVMCP